MSPHFGHVTAFTLVHYDENTKEIIEMESLMNASHELGGLYGPS
ncbi:MAG: hypothetical protein ACTSWY_05025 [Promethearchaeota archaeon]